MMVAIIMVTVIRVAIMMAIESDGFVATVVMMMIMNGDYDRHCHDS